MSDYPDFNISALLKGMYGTEVKPVALDKEGHLVAILKALYGTIPTGLQCDVDGNITVNLNAQALGEVITRNKYGACEHKEATIFVISGETKTVIDISKKGMCYLATLSYKGVSDSKGDTIGVFIDDKTIIYDSVQGISTLNSYSIYDNPMSITYENDTDYWWKVRMTCGYTFEDRYKITFKNNSSGNYSVVFDGIFGFI